MPKGGSSKRSLISTTISWRAWWTFLALVVAGFLLYHLRDVFTALLTALGLAYILNPLVNQLERKGMPRTVAVFVLCVLLLILFTLLILFVAPLVFAQIQDFIRVLPDKLHRLYAWLDMTVAKYFSYQLPQTSAEALEQFRMLIENNSQAWLKPAGQFVQGAFANFVDIVLFLLNLLLIPVLAVYLLVDFKKVGSAIQSWIPRRHIGLLTRLLGEFDEILSAFFRGQLTLVLTMALFYSAGFVLCGVPMGLVVGGMSGLGHLVPYLGPGISMILGLIMILTDFSGWLQLLGFLVVIGLAQFIESFLLTPRLVGQRLGLKPVTTILSLLIFGKLFGLLGLLMAIPLAALCKVLALSFKQVYQKSAFYLAS